MTVPARPSGDRGFQRSARTPLDVKGKRQRLVAQRHLPAEIDFLQQDKVPMHDMWPSATDASRLTFSRRPWGPAHWRFDFALCG